MNTEPKFILQWTNTGEDAAKPPGPCVEYFDNEPDALARQKAIDPWQLKSRLRPFLPRDVHEWEIRTGL